MAEIVLDGVTKRWPDGVVAVDRFSLAVADGELVVLVGPSGCGKSTLLELVAGLEDVTEGTITIGGRIMNDAPPRERDLAMVFQSYALYPHMTVRQNMAFPLELAGLDRETIRAKVEEAAAMLELTAELDRRPAQLSGGQRQRVAMGRAIVRRPNAFLMDEPLSNLDARLRVEMRRQVARIQKALATTTLYVTHDQTEAMTLGDRIVVMRRGVVQQIGPPRDLYEAPANLFVAGFIGSPAMNFVPATVDGGTLRSPLGETPLPDRLRRGVQEHGGGSEVIIGIRPEHFEHAAEGGPAPADAAVVRATLELVEPMGAESFAYFTLRGDRPRAAQLADLAADAGAGSEGGRLQMVARLDSASQAAEGDTVELRYDPGQIHLFDARSGRRLTG